MKLWRVLANVVGGSKDVGITTIAYKRSTFDEGSLSHDSQPSQEMPQYVDFEQSSFGSNWCLVSTCLYNENSWLVKRFELLISTKRISNEWVAKFYRFVHIYFLSRFVLFHETDVRTKIRNLSRSVLVYIDIVYRNSKEMRYNSYYMTAQEKHVSKILYRLRLSTFSSRRCD